MKNKLIILALLFLYGTTINAQLYTPSGTVQGSSGNGNVGIGTSNPDAKLNVVGNINIDNIDWATDNELRIREGGSNSYGAFFKYGLNDLLAIGTRNADLDFTAIQISRGSLNTVFNGNVGIGTNGPTGLLDVKKTSLNAGGQAVLNLIGSTWTGDGTSLILNQLWNDRSYKTIIDNYGGATYAQTGSGLKIQTSFWNGSDVSTITSLVLSPVGNLGLGVVNPSNKLDVNGTIHSKEVKVDMSGWSDFVFKKEYNLPPLEQVEKHIAEEGHLENIPSEGEVLKNGINLGEMNAKLLQKIEELTLYIIEQNKKNNTQHDQITSLQDQVDSLKKQNETLSLILERLSKLEHKLN
ncbi:hypothetical protein SAMN02927916_2328 [Flavobacterium anhuiense]|uniref:Uncharacterized protein n=1 Tax=Flavobacterium anhuiense TaxID=459526 RepID=A0ABY0LQC7_9FLAO|nr:hypothetical protein [Flavobacterium anhuiense]SCY50331.1 hypothetical protein SAMN02927916_2328 [Flavobacterium anhuiense]